jgi:hypothetical protein
MEWSREYFALDLPEWRVLGEAGLIAAAAILVLEIGWRASRVIGRRRPDQAEEREPVTAR